MAYIDRDQSQQNLVSGVATAVLITAVGYALVTGLAMSVIHNGRDTIPLVNYPDDAKPPPPGKQLPQVKQTTIPETTTVPVKVPIETPPRPIDTITVPLKPFTIPDTILGSGSGTELPPVQLSQAAGVKPVGNPGGWVSEDDYPPSALRAGLQGRTGFRLTIGGDGRVTDCAVTQSSGSEDLDQTACRLLRKRAHFTPARDAQGNSIPSSYASSVLWRIPTD